MHGVSGFVAQGAPIRQVLRAVGSLIGPKAARHRGTELAGWGYGNDHQYCMGKRRFLLRSASLEDSQPYFEQNYNPLDRELVRMTGCKDSFTREEVTSFF